MTGKPSVTGSHLQENQDSSVTSAVASNSGVPLNAWNIGLKEPAFAALLMLVAIVYFWQLPSFPIHGEESRWAGGAVEMLRTGDWIVPRQQGQVFPERPPLNSWLMAILGWIFGDVNVWAVRIPSVIAIIATSGIAYLYTRQFVSSSGAFAAGVIYATFGQVLQIGRLGESEAVLACFVTASLLSWHTGYLQGWNRALTWTLACVFAALAALTKGLQGPVYLVAITGVYLLYRRDWSWIFGWQPWLGAGIATGIIALWQIPFYYATDLQACRDIWTGLVTDRITWTGLLSHVASYPLETIGCLFPWSLMLVQLAHRGFREQLSRYSVPLQYLMIAIIVSYPSVWLVTGARGRYFMPLYGICAVAIGLIVHVSVEGAVGSWARRGWLRFARITAMILVLVALVLFATALIPGQHLGGVTFGLVPTTMFLISSIGLGSIVWRRDTEERRLASLRQLAAFSLALGLAYAVIAPAIATRHGFHVREETAAIRDMLPANEQWVSFGPLHHRFVYHLNRPVDELPWPDSVDELPGGLDYFLLDYHVLDTKDTRLSGRGRTWTTTPGTLPFPWEEVARIPMDRGYQDSESWVIVGKVRR